MTKIDELGNDTEALVKLAYSFLEKADCLNHA